MREPIVAGQFYPTSFHELDLQINQSFEHPLGPGTDPGKRKGKIGGAIVPHAGYPFSGPCAAWSYKAIGEAELPEAYVIIGLNHKGMESAFSADDWMTPFGPIKNHTALTEKLSQATDIPIDERVHAEEHSIEVQLPFLQHVTKDRLAELRIVPLMIGSEMEFESIALQIRQVIGEKYIVTIISSDFTHHGPAYGYTPFVAKVKDGIYNLDKKAIRFIAEADSKGFLKYVKDKDATICGRYPIALGIELMKEKRIKLEMYYTSGDILGDYANVVGYASILFV